MNPADKSPTIIVHEESDSLEELSEYLDVLSSSARLRIVKFLEKSPVMPVRSQMRSRPVTRIQKNTWTSWLGIGVIKKEAGLGAPDLKRHPSPSGNIRWFRGGLEAIIRNLGLFSNARVQIVGGEISRRLEEVKGTLSKEVLGNCPAAIVLGGPDDGKAFILKTDTVAVGRTDPDHQTSFDPGKDIVLADGYTAVTRVSKPHGRFLRENGIWYIEDCGSTGGTQLNNKKIEDRTRVPLRDGDLVELAKGISGVNWS